jgi:hypothetical protein
MTDNLKNSDAIAATETQNEEEVDDNDYEPHFIVKLLRNPDLLPREYREDFNYVFEDFEFTHDGRAKTAVEYVLVNEATKLTLSIAHLDRMESAILINQERPGVESLFAKTHEAAAMQGAEAGIRSAAIISAQKYFADPVFRVQADRAFEAAGYAPAAMEGEAYLRALPALGVIHRQKAANRKALFNILRDLETRYSSRHPEEKMLVDKPATRASETKRSKPKGA